MADSELMTRLLKAIDVLEHLESAMEIAPTQEIEQILQEAWLKVSHTFPEDFKDATHLDASSEGLRRYLKVQAFFLDPTRQTISPEELELYYQNQSLPAEDATDFFFPDES
ncbi:hypothetical protein NIES2135_51710 [Leptolyngbya boryana NIES-2135]|jgi:hypothetical protein|uniref:Uncharacterized protein n=1 Tax=Leptolyngbya boryana NIES-2135 TaxID=1973484 RepID=A0A1Z4JNS8_LEPBY|nr:MULTISPECIES: hypothetical protein [Leptolyngbya]BAY58298.1 hypothetical protein NIES2135_51710 [Leptolyngbya boryana NIES-2135]MBD2367973.1 hypothetical protein [Leptolyngbya sp. FACHB-161]MBD2374497.1 hypothetical protein [Leptolyngbya sp. FACHB-238]MBD2398919.1 hypothetical protein [Leptolyngbya sp. FACHB-239]MBD2405320.1 hypothetical protein [Leptolyngbya sp. FACHB-402]